MSGLPEDESLVSVRRAPWGSGMNRAARRASSCLEEVGGSRTVKVISTKPGRRMKKMKPRSAGESLEHRAGGKAAVMLAGERSWKGLLTPQASNDLFEALHRSHPVGLDRSLQVARSLARPIMLNQHLKSGRYSSRSAIELSLLVVVTLLCVVVAQLLHCLSS